MDPNMQARPLFLGLLLLLVLCVIKTANAQSRQDLYSSPKSPDAERLAFHNLEVAWLDNLPAYQRKDGIHDITLLGIDSINSREIVLVQLKSGTVVALDAETGRRIWMARPDYGYEVVRALAWNHYSVFAQCKNTLYAWNRQTGELMFRHLMDQVVSAPFIASNKQLFICDERGKLDVLTLPPFDRSGTRYMARADFAARISKLRSEIKKQEIPPAALVPGQPTPPEDNQGNPNPVTKLAEILPGGAEAGVAMDPGLPFIGLGARAAFGELNMADLTDLEKKALARASAPIDPSNPDDARFLDRDGEPQMLPVWSLNIGQSVAFRPIQGENHLLLGLNLLPENAALGSTLTGDAIHTQGGGLVIEKRERVGTNEYANSNPSIMMPPMLTKGILLNGPTRYQNIAYMADNMGTITAWSIENNAKSWKTNIGGGVDLPMLVTASDLYVHGEKEGLWRLDRASGRPLWSMKSSCGRTVNAVSEATLPLSSGPRLVASLDIAGRLLLLDKITGLRLGLLEIPCWVVPVQNRYNDRIYLAANNGSIICLRSRDLQKPVRHNPDEREWTLTNPTVAQFLAELRSRHGLEIFVSEKSFKAQNVEVPLAKKMDLSDPNLNFDTLPSANRLLGKVGCRIEELGGQLMLVPSIKLKDTILVP